MIVDREVDRETDKLMEAALKEARKAGAKNEVPVGAVIAFEGRIIARAHNIRMTSADPTAHAEILALRRAGKKLGHWNLEGCDLYVTKEPCVMCSGAVVLARIRRVFYGAYDKRFGCCGTVYNLAGDKTFNHRAETFGGIRECECAQMLTDFFKERRK